MKSVKVYRFATFAILLVVAVSVVLIAGSLSGDPDQYARELIAYLISVVIGYAAGKYV